MFAGSAFLSARMKYFSFAFFLFISFATQLFSTPLHRQIFATLLRYLRSSAFYR